MKTTRKTTEQEKQVMEFLNVLRESGQTNMFCASTYIVDEFEIKHAEAVTILKLWMNNFNEEGNYEHIKI